MLWQRRKDNFKIATHAPGSSAYNPIERQIAPLLKGTASIIFLFYTLGNHLDASNKIIDLNLEIKNFQAAGKIQRKFGQSQSQTITQLLHRTHGHLTRCMMELYFIILKSGKHKNIMVQIIKPSDVSCCKAWRTYYPTFFPLQYLPVLSKNVLKIDQPKGLFRSLFRSLFLAASLKIFATMNTPQQQNVKNEG